MSTLLFIYTSGCLVALAVGYIAGKSYGQRKGEAIGWQDGYFGRIANDKAKRDPRGRFIVQAKLAETETRRNWKEL